MKRYRLKTQTKLFIATLLWLISLGIAYEIDKPTITQAPEIQIEYVEIVTEVPVPVLEQTAIEVKPLGEFEVTYYTAGVESTGKDKSHPAYGITRSGARVEKDITIAVDPNIIPLGSYLYIEGIGFRVAQDTGGAIKGNRVDIYTPNLQDALEGGRHTAKVYILGGDDLE